MNISLYARNRHPCIIRSREKGILPSAFLVSDVVGLELIGVHTFDSVTVTGGAFLSFGEDKLRLINTNIFHVDTLSSVKSASTAVN